MPHTTPHTFALGDATITIINAGDMLVNLAEEMAVPENVWQSLSDPTLQSPQPFPSQSIHIELAGASILVDINDYALAISLDSSYLPPSYTPPPGIAEQLLTRGIHPQDITHLLITHAHFDHYAGTTIARNGDYVPRFSHAHVYLGQPDWDNPETQHALHDPSSLQSRTLGVLHKQGLLELVNDSLDLTPAVRIFPAPGESPGHQIVRVHSQGQTLYCLGDLFHHPIEVEQPAWMVKWANAAANLNSRLALIQAAIQENALLVAAHMPIGRIEGTPSHPKWVSL